MQLPSGSSWQPVVIATCARCEEPAEGWAYVRTERGSFRLELCERHLGEVLDGARPMEGG